MNTSAKETQNSRARTNWRDVSTLYLDHTAWLRQHTSMKQRHLLDALAAGQGEVINMEFSTGDSERMPIILSDSSRHFKIRGILLSDKATIAAPPGQEYVDPYLFEIGHFESREEYEQLSRTAKIKRRARS